MLCMVTGLYYTSNISDPRNVSLNYFMMYENKTPDWDGPVKMKVCNPTFWGNRLIDNNIKVHFYITYL